MLRRVLLAGLLTVLIVGFAAAEGDKTLTQAKEPAPQAPAKGGPVVLLGTSMGNIKIELFDKKAPKTVKNFLKYVNDGYFANTIFHRVMPGFVIQGGGFTAEMVEKTATYPAIPLESQAGLANARGTLAMARTSQPNSATCQFFINLNDNNRLDYTPEVGSPNGYAVFGRVIEGMDVVDRIAAVPTQSAGQHLNVPIEAVLIKSAKELP